MGACKYALKILDDPEEVCKLANSLSGLIASVLRFLAFDKTSSFTDPTYNAVELIIWTVAEPGIYLIAACLITYRPLLDKFGSKIKTQTKTESWPSKPSYSSGPAEIGHSHRQQPEVMNRFASSTLEDHSTNSNRGILLPSMSGVRGHSFRQLPDVHETLRQDHSQKLAPTHAAIVRTTDIHMAWDNV